MKTLASLSRDLRHGDIPDRDLQYLNGFLEQLPAEEILIWLRETFTHSIAATSSFQTQSLPLLHMIATETPDLAVWFLDTGFHFQETLAYRDQLVDEWGLNLSVVGPPMGPTGFKRKHGELYHSNPDLCCYLNKIEPMIVARKRLRVWISGIRRDQTPHRRATPIVTRLPDGVYKACPLATWSRAQVWDYIRRHRLPEHPLHAQGYLSIGCAPCTRASPGTCDERGGRWEGWQKRECGLHLEPDPQGASWRE